jgi:NAD(P)-dependent dehydrogenase (short-subunit alcohol dehydrogenase family)
MLLAAISGANVAVAVFGRSLALAIAPIRVNVIAAGLLEDTSSWSNQTESKRADLTKWAESALPVQHLGQPAELAQAVLGLTIDPDLTGVILPGDGGVKQI